ncbi:hypothetical protein DFA_12060 [Cavenderia fasciculata]|uniref:Uncharacterized protein n=1 Tax=Cavenderia fasciculata TaxID=261658 RepID=F4QFI9_CACFS|nr:uncharacterized protein DFA_12060 [Cavenderia fasciculata]EGG14290.1 hypothetical protein DFA_12060 [Cavenderia fasciculata]|eukprot:XP_004350999.1 hypothetical protein DFA_12060 [Cavenderia fasciculata]
MKCIPFFNACMKETLCIRPVDALSLPRRATEDICVKDKYIIPKDHEPLGVCNDEKYWKEPTVFNPYRWLSDDRFDGRNSTSNQQSSNHPTINHFYNQPCKHRNIIKDGRNYYIITQTIQVVPRQGRKSVDTIHESADRVQPPTIKQSTSQPATK